MTPIAVTPFAIAQRFIGTKEAPGVASNALIVSMLRLDQSWPSGDDIAWCSAFVNAVCWLLQVPRSKSLAARSWLTVGQPIGLDEARRGFDVVVLKRGSGVQPGPEMLDAPGHVGFFAGLEGDQVQILGGNQGDMVSIALFPRDRVLGVRRLVA